MVKLYVYTRAPVKSLKERYAGAFSVKFFKITENGIISYVNIDGALNKVLAKFYLFVDSQ